MSILYATLRQAVSIDAAFIMVPGHIFIAFDSGLSPEKGPRGIDSGRAVHLVQRQSCHTPNSPNVWWLETRDPGRDGGAHAGPWVSSSRTVGGASAAAGPRRGTLRPGGFASGRTRGRGGSSCRRRVATGRSRGHLMRAMPWLQSPQTRNADAARTRRGRRNLPKVGAWRCS